MNDYLLKKYTLIVVTLATFLIPFMVSAVNLAVPAIGKQFNSSTVFLSWVATSYILASASFLLPFGRLSDMMGRKKIFMWGGILFSLSSLLCGFAWSIKALIFFRVFQGIAGAMVFSTSMAILTSVFPPQERGKVLGINVATVYAGLSFGPALGGMMTHYLGWKSIFFFTAFVCVFAALMACFKLRSEWAGAPEERFDYPGTILYLVGFFSLMYGVSSIATLAFAKFMVIIGMGFLILFIRYEVKTKDPILNLRLFKNITFAFSNLAALINYSATYAVTFLLSLYLQVARGYDAQAAGLILLFQPVMQAILSPFTGTLSDRVEPRTLASLGMGLTTLGLLGFCFISAHTPIWLIIINLVLLGTGFALFSSPNSNAVMGSVEHRFYGVASSTLATMRQTGQTVSMAVMTLIIAVYVGNVVLTPDLAGKLILSTRISFAIFSLLCFGGIFASWARGKVRNTPFPGR